jgi:hypothetical protein
MVYVHIGQYTLVLQWRPRTGGCSVSRPPEMGNDNLVKVVGSAEWIAVEILRLCLPASSWRRVTDDDDDDVPTAGTQAFLMDYPQGERAITHHTGPVRIGGC